MMILINLNSLLDYSYSLFAKHLPYKWLFIWAIFYFTNCSTLWNFIWAIKLIV